MKRLVAVALGSLLFACGPGAPTRTTDLGELWISTDQNPEGAPDLDIDFGAVARGSRRTVTIEGFNAGQDPIGVTSIQFDESSDGSFYLNAPSLPIELVAGERFSLSVTFAPGESGESSTRLVLKATGRTSGARGVLRGVGE